MSKLTNVTGTSYNRVVNTLYANRTAEDSCTRLLPYIKPTFRILDVGCGPGSITLDLAKLVHEGYVLGIDINKASLDSARAAAHKQEVHNIEFLECNVTDMSGLDSETFDVVHAHQVLLHLSDPVAAMKEMRRLLRPGGIVATRDMAHQIIIPLLPGIAKGVEAVARMYDARGADRFIGERTHIVANKAGFEWPKIEASSDGSDIAGWSNREKFGQAVKARFRDELIEGGYATAEECDKHAEAWEEWTKKPEARVIGLSGSLLCWK